MHTYRDTSQKHMYHIRTKFYLDSVRKRMKNFSNIFTDDALTKIQVNVLTKIQVNNLSNFDFKYTTEQIIFLKQI